VAAAGAAARGATAYLNLESGDCHGDLDASAGALVAAGERTPVRGGSSARAQAPGEQPWACARAQCTYGCAHGRPCSACSCLAS